MDLKDINFKHWWIFLAAAGATIAVAAMVPKSTLGIVSGLSLLFFGVGEWMNRKRTSVKETVEGLRGFKVVDDYPWKPTILGIIFDFVGVSLFGVTVYLVWTVARQVSS